jgi:hypothetical protein
LTTEERLSDIVEIYGLLWLDAFSVDLCSHIGSSAALLTSLHCPVATKIDVRCDVGDWV